MSKVRCIDCQHAQWQRDAIGRIKRVAGRCGAVMPVITYLCLSEPVSPSKNAIWPDHAGLCDGFQPKTGGGAV